MSQYFNPNYPSIEDLIKKSKRRIPKFAFEYLDGGCNDDISLDKNLKDIRKIELQPLYINAKVKPNLQTKIFDQTYSAPFGISPIGLQGLIWPGSAEILAKAAKFHNIPFILSTVTTASIEKIASITEGKTWFQLYNPSEDYVREDIIKRLESSRIKVLVLLCDVPSFGFRPRDIRNGLSIPPRMTLKNLFQILCKPNWAISTLINGKPNFESIQPYLPKGMNMKQLGTQMNKIFSGYLDLERIKKIRERWKGKIILKGVTNILDVDNAYKIGIDAIIISNHGGRQLDASPSSIHCLSEIHKFYKDKLPIFLDSGIRNGVDVARCLSVGSEFCFLGRTFMYSVAALGRNGGDHAITLLKTQLTQVMEQLGCESTEELQHRLYKFEN